MLSRTLIAAVTMLLTFASMADAVDLLYVSMDDNTIVTYDTSINDSNAINASQYIFANTNMDFPLGVAFDKSGNLYAANYGGSNTISKFSSSGTYLSSFSSTAPCGLAIDSSGNIYAANYDIYTVSKYSSEGNYLGSITSNVSRPTGLVIDSSDSLYVANNYNSTISKYDSSGFYQSTGSIDSSHLVGSPQGLAIDSTGNLYAATNENEISKYDISGNFIKTIGSNLNLDAPRGIALDSLGNLYVANIGSKKISKFDPSGNFVFSWSTGTAKPHYLAFKPVTVPEPSTYALATIAAIVMAWVARHQKLELRESAIVSQSAS